jgi:hypothetical protein
MMMLKIIANDGVPRTTNDPMPVVVGRRATLQKRDPAEGKRRVAVIASRRMIMNSINRWSIVGRMLKAGAWTAIMLALSISWVPTPSASGDEPQCPNEALRLEVGTTMLPDCRTYEMVSPPYKEGYPIFAVSYSSDGAKTILYSLADLAESPGAGESGVVGAAYLDTRITSSWHISPLNPPLSEYVGQVPIAFEADRGATLWEQHRPAQSAFTRDLYARSADGVFRFVGPLDPPSEIGGEESNVMQTGPGKLDTPVAATADYEHNVLFAGTPEDYWPFDATEGAGGSLYEYTGAGNERPNLVGVSGEKGSTRLLGLCGTNLGGGTAYNALSADGETIFFTLLPQGADGCLSQAPATAEIYARLHGGRASSIAAVTVNVSASQCTVTCGGESGKNFEGASDDGERLFFTSTQRLTDDAVDGTASGDAAKAAGCAAMPVGKGGCNLYVYDFAAPAGERLKLVAGGGEVLGVAGVAEDGSRVYFVSRVVLGSAAENEYGVAPRAGQPNMYVYDPMNSTTKFITTLDEQRDEVNWRRAFRRPVEVAGEEGRFLLFASSRAGVTPDDTSTQAQLFEYNATTAELVRVTKGEDDYNQDGNGVSAAANLEALEGLAERLGKGSDFKSTSNRLNVAVDGKTIFFETSGQLSRRALAAEQGCSDIYEFHSAGPISQGSVHLVSDGRDTQPYKGVRCGAQLQAVDASGANVLFFTADSLLPGDMDGVQRDIYDARVGGGFGSLSGVASCVSGSSCEEASGGSSGTLTLGSVRQRAEPGVLPVTRSRAPGSLGKERKGVNRQTLLARALHACKTEPKRRRATCRRNARRRYGPKARAKQSAKRREG